MIVFICSMDRDSHEHIIIPFIPRGICSDNDWGFLYLLFIYNVYIHSKNLTVHVEIITVSSDGIIFAYYSFKA